MKSASLLLATAALAIWMAGPAHSQPVFNMAWNGCYGTSGVVAPPAQNLEWTDRFAQYKLYASVTNVSIPAGEFVFGHDVYIEIGVNLPDAWRFDPAGCQTANAAQVNYNDLGAIGCPGLRSGASVTVTGFIWTDPVAGMAVISAATGYPDGRASAAADPSTTYLLWEMTFPMTSAGTAGGSGPCVGADQLAIFITHKVELVIGENVVDARLVTTGAGAWGCATFNGEGVVLPGSGCRAQAEDATWGQVKGLYR
jgi:hypothetical protein